MARPLRLEFPGALYHLTARGNARARIYLDEADYNDFLERLGEVCDRFHWRAHAYCLMSNHYHLASWFTTAITSFPVVRWTKTRPAVEAAYREMWRMRCDHPAA